MNHTDLLVVLPLIVLVAWSLVLILVDLWVPARSKGITAALAAIGLLGATAATLVVGARTAEPQGAFYGMVVLDRFSVYLQVLFLISGVAGVGIAYDYLKRMGIERGEYYTLLLLSVSGMMLMSMANDLLIIFLALELLSIPLYVLVGFARPQVESEEASLKYFLIGAFASGFVLYGSALIYGATGNTNLSAIVAAANRGSVNLTLLLAGALLLLVGFGFKVAAFPFHMWTPDVYQGAPSPVTGFMSVAVKAAGFAALLRVFTLVLPAVWSDLTPILLVIAALTILFGNVVAIAQSNIKRMLAYSSIAHAGYILMAFVPFGQNGMQPLVIGSALFYLVAYGLTSIGAWAVVVALEQSEGQGLEIDDYRGLGWRHPALGAAMAVFMLSFTGVPPLMGFWGKLYLFSSTINAGFLWLAVVGLIGTLISAYYYLRVVVVMYMRQGEPVVRVDKWVYVVALGSAVVLVVLSFVPAPLFQAAAGALLALP